MLVAGYPANTSVTVRTVTMRTRLGPEPFPQGKAGSQRDWQHLCSIQLRHSLVNLPLQFHDASGSLWRQGAAMPLELSQDAVTPDGVCHERVAVPCSSGPSFGLTFVHLLRYRRFTGAQQQASQQPLKRAGELNGAQGFDDADEGMALGDDAVGGVGVSHLFSSDWETLNLRARPAQSSAAMDQAAK